MITLLLLPTCDCGFRSCTHDAHGTNERTSMCQLIMRMSYMITLKGLSSRASGFSFCLTTICANCLVHVVDGFFQQSACARSASPPSHFVHVPSARIGKSDRDEALLSGSIFQNMALVDIQRAKRRWVVSHMRKCCVGEKAPTEAWQRRFCFKWILWTCR